MILGACVSALLHISIMGTLLRGVLCGRTPAEHMAELPFWTVVCFN